MTGILHICSCMEGMSFLNECQPLYIEKFSACAVASKWLVCMQAVAMQTSHWISNRTGDARFRFRCGKRGLISGIAISGEDAAQGNSDVEWRNRM